MAQATFHIPSIKGNFMVWAWTTEAGFTYNVTLKDSATVYINNVARTSTNPLPINSGASVVNGTDLQLTINVPQAATLKTVVSSNNMVDPNVGMVATTYTVMGEDAGDNDYNDVWFSVTFWKAQG